MAAWKNAVASSRVVGLAVAIALVAPTVVPRTAAAQSKEELAEARTLFQQGLSLEAANDFKAALEKFEAVAKVKLTPQVRFHIARCKEQLGRLTEALGDYKLAEYEATEAKAKETDEIAAAREALEQKIPKLVITIAEGSPRAKITVDGTELGEAKLGKDVFVDPGEHTVIARWPGGKRSKQKIKVAEGESKTLQLEAPEGAGDDEEDDTTEPPAGEPSEPPPVAPPPKLPESGGSSALPWVVGGLGVASLALAGVFYTVRNGAEADLQGGCRDNVCPERLQSTADKGETFTLLTNVALGVGVVGIGTAAVLFLTQGSSTPDKPAAPADAKRLRVHVATTPSYTGVQLVGGF